MKKTLFLFSILLLTVSINAQDKIKWQSLDEIRTAFSQNQKPIFFYFYDVNSDSCKLQEELLNTDEVSNYINILFYPIKIDVNSKEDYIFFDSTKYTPASSDSINQHHNLVRALLGDAANFPAFLLFSKEAKGEVFSGYKTRSDLFSMLIFYAENIYLSTDFETFDKYYKKTYPPGQSQIMTRLIVDRTDLEEAFEKAKATKKKMVVNLYNNYKTSSTMMSLTTFNTPPIANYLNKNFIYSELNVRTKDTISVLGGTYINTNETHEYHQLPIAMLEGKMIFPAFLILDENGQLLNRTQVYVTPERMEIILAYYLNDAYKTEKWTNFEKTFKSKLYNDQ